MPARSPGGLEGPFNVAAGRDEAGAATVEMAACATALGLPAGSDEAAIVAAIHALRERGAAAELLKRVAVLDPVRVRALLDLPAGTCLLDCAAALADRMPPDLVTTAIATMQLIQRRERIRELQVREIMTDALKI